VKLGNNILVCSYSQSRFTATRQRWRSHDKGQSPEPSFWPIQEICYVRIRDGPESKTTRMFRRVHEVAAPWAKLDFLSISVERPRSTRSSSVLTLARPSSSSSLKITNRSFRYAHLVSGISSLCLFINLILVPVPPFPTQPFLHPSPSSSSDSPLCTSIHLYIYNSLSLSLWIRRSEPLQECKNSHRHCFSCLVIN